MIYGTISGRDVMANPFNYTLAPPDAAFLKNITKITLTDPLVSKKSNLGGIPSVDIRWEDPKLKAEPGKLQYRWYLGNKLQATTTDSGWIPSKSGTYRVWTRNAAEQWQKSCAQTIVVTTDIHDPVLGAPLSLFPNPSAAWLNIAGIAAQVTTLEVYAVTGRQVLSVPCSAKELKLDISILAPGMYYTRCLDGEGKMIQPAARFVKQ